jgi:hypothetical protein
VLELPFNLFDILLVAVLVAGIVRGRKQGFSNELLGLLKWLTLLVGCALIYRPAGSLAANAGFFSLLTAYIFAYVAAGLAIFLLFRVLERRWAPKLVGSDIFGRGEYFLGMGSGMIRFACILLMSLSLLNAREFTPADLKAMDQYQQEAFGTHIFPGLYSLQSHVFEKSLLGPFIKEDLSFLLITPTEIDR